MIESQPRDISVEADSIASLLPEVVASVKAKIAAGETKLQVLYEETVAEFPHLLTAFNSISGMKSDIAANRKVVFANIGARLGELLDAVLPK